MKKKFSSKNIPPFLRNKHLRWVTLFTATLSILGTVIAFLYSSLTGVFLLAFVCLGLAYTFNLLNHLSANRNEYISDLSYRIHRGESETMLEMPMGIMILSDDQKIEWVNPYLQPYFGDQYVLGQSVVDVAPGLNSLISKYWNSNDTNDVTWNHHHFSMLIQKEFHTVYLMDVTSYYDIQERYNNEKISIGEIFLDNYDEITQSMTDQEISNLLNYVTNELTAWAREFGMYLKQIDDDHFMIIAYASSLKAIEEDKFKILDKIRESTSKQNFPLTLSVGIAYGDNNLNSLADQSQSDLDLALGRGGDQVVVKAKNQEARFYGGKTNPMEKRTRVRARMTSQALQEIMKESDQIFVQGHQRPDMDAIGACFGIRRIAKMNNKKCWIVVDQSQLHTDVKRLIETSKDYPEIYDSIITPEEALQKATDDSLLIMVDHSKPSMSISSDLYERLSNRVVIIDHHRRGEEFPPNPILVYIEPYASSTCELITEMFEYQSQDAEPINKLEATAMLTGIFIDTKSFSMRTGTRTFDAASYLRSAGADSEEMQQFMEENVDDYLARNHLISLVKFVDKDRHIAMVIGEDDHPYDPVTAAQAADSILTMSGVEASFVATERAGGMVGISARSNGEVNVQIIMERLGGGGHLSSGATQIKDKKVSEVEPILDKTIKDVLSDETDSDNDDKIE
ncbi:DHH family phosphoesterase [Nicoliella spurrieriana]|uniref:Cyclic-di-AMP phosphodiesterase n=1 Tax=Nicoliella spurrieriana TaxID=2925830 RepID=A0A976RSX4_9LACO|nr:DHH family phosphoesterase [Nicoliella spurrieriana]UQS87250.1 DHH family phosphoesterase [Nicoliella spurrieriana]